MATGRCEPGRKNYQCVHAEKKTKNTRKLDDHIGEDSNRKQELTTVRKRDCKWHCYISWKDPVSRGGDNKTWVLGVGNQEHSHDMVANPLSYDVHKKRQPDHARAIELARAHRMSGLTYKKSEDVLDNTEKDWDEGFHLKRKKFYNLVPSTTRNREDILTGLLAALDSPIFTSRLRFSYVKNANGIIIKRIHEQIVLIDDFQRGLVKRFCVVGSELLAESVSGTVQPPCDLAVRLKYSSYCVPSLQVILIDFIVEAA
ncbi:MAG: hypothetical protein Q9175_007396 [Cornicularia normoerica]